MVASVERTANGGDHSRHGSRAGQVGWLARRALKAGLWTALRVPDRRIVVGQHLQAHIEKSTGIQTNYIPNAPSQIDYALFLKQM